MRILVSDAKVNGSFEKNKTLREKFLIKILIPPLHPLPLRRSEERNTHGEEIFCQSDSQQGSNNKRKARRSTGFSFVLSGKDSNPHRQNQNLKCYRYTTGQWVLRMQRCKFPGSPEKDHPLFSVELIFFYNSFRSSGKAEATAVRACFINSGKSYPRSGSG